VKPELIACQKPAWNEGESINEDRKIQIDTKEKR
jgi:hypothetical protein